MRNQNCGDVGISAKIKIDQEDFPPLQIDQESFYSYLVSTKYSFVRFEQVL